MRNRVDLRRKSRKSSNAVQITYPIKTNRVFVLVNRKTRVCVSGAVVGVCRGLVFRMDPPHVPCYPEITAEDVAKIGKSRSDRENTAQRKNHYCHVIALFTRNYNPT